MTLLLLALLTVEPITVTEIHNLLNEGRAGEALPRAEAAALANPGNRPLQKAFALVLRSMGELDSALAVYDRLLVADESDDDTRLGKALVLSWQGRHDAALALYAEIQPESESYFEALVGKGRVAGWAGRYASALRHLAEAESLAPGNTEVTERRAQVLSWSGDHAAAIRLYRGLSETAPGNADYLFSLGQNHEWADQPMAARRYYRRALELAPERDDIRDALGRVAAVAAPAARLEFADAFDNDGDVVGAYREYRFRCEQRLNDRLRSSGMLSYSGNRRGALGHDYLLVRAELAYRPVSWVRLTTQVQGDILGFGFKAAVVGWEVERAWLVWSGEAGRMPFEPTQNIGAFSGSTAFTARPVTGLRLDCRAARLQVIDDGNVKTSFSVGAGFDLLAKPRLALAYTFSFDDFRSKSPRYYSPRGLNTSVVGISFGSRWRRTGLSVRAAGGANAALERVVRAGAALDYEFLPNTRVSFDTEYSQTTGRGRYVYGSIVLGVSRSF